LIAQEQQLRASVDARRADLNALMNQERDRLRALFQVAVNGVTQSLTDGLKTGLLKAVSGHGTVLRGSEEAFSMLNRTAGTESYYTRAMEHGINGPNGVNAQLGRMAGAMERAPAIRRARL
jgi:hypothetical protein